MPVAHVWDSSRPLTATHLYTQGIFATQRLVYTPTDHCNRKVWYNIPRSMVCRDYGTTALLTDAQFEAAVSTGFIDSDSVHPRDVVVVLVSVPLRPAGRQRRACLMPAWYVAVAPQRDRPPASAALVRFNHEPVMCALRDHRGPFARKGSSLVGPLLDYFGSEVRSLDGAFAHCAVRHPPSAFRSILGDGGEDGSVALVPESQLCVARVYCMPPEPDAVDSQHLHNRRLANEAFEAQRGLHIDVPNDFYCAITCELMVDPVICTDGFSYERAAINRWFAEGNTTSPRVNESGHEILCANRSLRIAIEDFVESAQRNRPPSPTMAAPHIHGCAYTPYNSYDRLHPGTTLYGECSWRATQRGPPPFLSEQSTDSDSTSSDIEEST